MAGIFPRFPPELMESIFSFLQVPNVDRYDEGLATLEGCAMHPLLCRFAERPFYTSVTVRQRVINQYPGLFSADQLVGWFAEDPRIPHYVRHVTIRLDPTDRCATRSDHTPWFGEILSRVPRLESILFFSDWLVGLNYSMRFIDGLAAWIKSPLLRTVTIANLFEFPLSALDGCTFKNLIFVNTEIERELRSVWAKNWNHLRSLTFVGFPVMRGFNLLFAALFPLCSNTLTSLDLNISDFWFGIDHSTIPPECVSLAAFSCLRQLTLHAAHHVLLGEPCPQTDPKYSNKSALPTICEFLATSPPSLTRLTIYFLIHFVDSCNIEVLSTIDLQPLVEALDSPSLARRHTELHIQILEYVPVAQATPAILPDQIIPTVCGSADFSRLLERGALAIKPAVEQVEYGCDCGREV